MPLRKNGTLIKSVISFATAAVIVGAVPAGAAAAACVQLPTTKAFSKVGDQADYSVAPGGDFETGAAGWTFTGKYSIVSGNETLGFFKGPVLSGTKSLKLPPGATATSPEFCVDESHPHFRFMAKADGAMAGYAVVVLYRNLAGQITKAEFTTSKAVSWGDGDWVASSPNALATQIPLDGPDASATVQIRFISTGNPLFAMGATRFDSLMVDPYRRG